MAKGFAGDGWMVRMGAADSVRGGVVYSVFLGCARGGGVHVHRGW